ncbi:DHH family phosphoesterase [Clostridiales bacterium COT073_COT-073]|nr:DHH family phosphoesterase [Clostridiales bacterium COT073_COT-073]
MKHQNVRLSARLKKYLLWPLISQFLLLVFTWIVYLLDEEVGLVFLVFSLLHAFIFLLIGLRMRKTIQQEIMHLSFSTSALQQEHLYYFNVPHAVLDMDGGIQWFDEKFGELIPDQNLKGKNIMKYLVDIKPENFPEDHLPFKEEIRFNDRFYEVVMQRHPLDNSNGLFENPDQTYYYSLYLYDINEMVELKKLSAAQECVFGYIYIDNYDEVVQSIEQVRQPLLMAIVDRNLQRFVTELKGILKKFEKDKYILILRREQLEVLMEKKFSILDEIRETNIGNELPVTISIGMGIHTGDFSVGLENAKTAIELALGRGGDQAVIKEGDKTLFFGGKTKGVENTSRVKARMKAYALKEIFAEADNIVIMGHHNPDMDSLGAAVGMYVCAREMKKEAHIIVNNVSTSIKGLYNRLLESEIYRDHVLVNNSKAKSLIRENTVVVVVDVNRPSYTECPDILPLASKVVVFDHHRTSVEQVENPVLRYVEPYASSTCEMVSEILRYISEKLKLNAVEADAMLAGITVDTKNFTVKAGVKTFEAAAFLKRNGADITRVRELFRNDMESYKARAIAVKDTMIYREGMAISTCPSNIPNPVLVAAQAADELLNIASIRASFVLTQVEDTIYVSARSFDTVNVQVIAEKMSGGGHLNMAGAQLTGMNMDSAIALVKQKIDEYLQEGENNDESNSTR